MGAARNDSVCCDLSPIASVGGASVPSQDAYRLLAQYYLGLAKACTEPSAADRYRVIAADYFDRAGQGGESSPVTQQQQAQPVKDAD